MNGKKIIKYIEKHDWCKIDKSAFEGNYHVYIGGNYTITNAQINELIV